MTLLNTIRATLGGLTLLLSLSPAGRVGAQTLTYDNLAGSASNPVQAFVNISKLGQSFTAMGSGTISSLSLNLTTSFSTTAPVYSVQLWSDSGGGTSLPGTLLATFVSNQRWSPNYSGTPSVLDASHVITFSSSNFAENYAVSSGTTYWLVVESQTGAARAWGVSSTALGPSAQFRPLTSTWSTLSQAGSFGGQVSLLAVPEPSTYAVIAGALVLGWAAWIRRRR